MTQGKTSQRKLNRREMLGLIGAAGVIAVVGCGDDDQPGGSTSTPTESSGGTATASATQAATSSATPLPVSCVITPDLTEGPYFVDERLNRSDIRSDPADGSVKEGVPLRIGLTVSDVNGEACTPINGALVDMWHCDAEGAYSDVSGAGQANTTGQKFLRGYQVTDENGQVEFLTIFPGWYSGRAVHIHFKVRTEPDSQQGYEFTSQFFFEEATTEAVYARAPYESRGSPNVSNASDNIFGQSGGELTLQLVEDGDGYAGTFHVGVNVA